MLAALIKPYAVGYERVQPSAAVCSRAFAQRGLRQVTEVKEPFSSSLAAPSAKKTGKPLIRRS